MTIFLLEHPRAGEDLTLSDPGGAFLPNPQIYYLPIVSGWAFQNQYLMVFQVEGIYIAY